MASQAAVARPLGGGRRRKVISTEGVPVSGNAATRASSASRVASRISLRLGQPVGLSSIPWHMGHCAIQGCLRPPQGSSRAYARAGRNEPINIYPSTEERHRRNPDHKVMSIYVGGAK